LVKLIQRVAFARDDAPTFAGRAEQRAEGIESAVLNLVGGPSLDVSPAPRSLLLVVALLALVLDKGAGEGNLILDITEVLLLELAWRQ
jgi:hypothetical protein